MITFLSAGAYNPFIYVYFTELGLNGEQVGWLSSLSPVMTMLLSSLIASYADRKNKRIRIMQISLALAALLIYLMHLPTRFTEIVMMMFLLAVVSSPIMSLAESLIARMAQRYGLNYGGMRLWGSFGFAISALGFGAIWQRVGFKPMFFVAGVLYIPLIVLAGKLEEVPAAKTEERIPFTHLFKDAGLVLLLVATFFSSVSNSLSMTFSGILARSLGGGNFLIGLLIAVGAFAELPVMFFSDRISARLRKINTILISYGLMAVAYIGFMLSPTANILPIWAIMKGLGYGLWITITIRLLIEHSPADWASTAQSLLVACMFGLAPLVAGPVGGWIHDTISPGAVFGLGVITLIMAAGVLIYAALSGKLE